MIRACKDSIRKKGVEFHTTDIRGNFHYQTVAAAIIKPEEQKIVEVSQNFRERNAYILQE